MDTSFQKSKNSSDEWYTPKDIIDALGEFDLDPCAPARQFYTAKKCYTIYDDGLKKEWHGRVWLNPPYSRPSVSRFIERMAKHGNGIALIFNRMDTALWHDVIFPTATSMLVIRGRIGFMRPDGTQAPPCGCGSVLIAWGGVNDLLLMNCKIKGKYIKIR